MVAPLPKCLPLTFSRGSTSLEPSTTCFNNMRLLPECSSHSQWLDTLLLPPCAFVAAPMEFAMMQPANGNGEFIA